MSFMSKICKSVIFARRTFRFWQSWLQTNIILVRFKGSGRNLSSDGQNNFPFKNLIPDFSLLHRHKTVRVSQLPVTDSLDFYLPPSFATCTSGGPRIHKAASHQGLVFIDSLPHANSCHKLYLFIFWTHRATFLVHVDCVKTVRTIHSSTKSQCFSYLEISW